MASQREEFSRMMSQLDSLTIAPNIAKDFAQLYTKELAQIGRAADAQIVQYREIAKRIDEISDAIRTFKMPDILIDMPTIDFARITASLQPTLDAVNAIDGIRKPLAVSQSDFLTSIVESDKSLASVAAKLGNDSKIIGSPDDASAEQDEPKIADYEPVYERLSSVGLIPLRMVDAIADQPELMRGLEPRDFEKLVAELLHSLGFENIILTPPSGDGGRDVLATKLTADIPLLFAFECKRYKNKIGLDLMRGLLGSVAHGRTKANMGVLVTTSSFTHGASDFIVSEPLVDGKDFNDLVSWLNTYKGHC